MNMTQGLMPPEDTEYTKLITVCKNLFRLTWKKSRFLFYYMQGFTVLSNFTSQNMAMAACSDNIYI
jgi:hypothetical protein